MWFPEAPLWRIALGERRLVRTVSTGAWPRCGVSCDSLEWVSQPGAEAWRGAVSALAQLLAGQAQGARAPELRLS